MATEEQDPDTSAIEHATDILVAYLSNNLVPASELPMPIGQVHAAITGLGEPAPEAKPVPPVNPKKTIFPDHIVSLEDGKSYKSMRRHLANHGLTLEDYRAKWGLPADYPMVAPSYSAARSELAKRLGLGRKPAAMPTRVKAAIKKSRPNTG